MKSNLPEEYLKHGGPGRKKGSVSGRRLILNVLDKMLADKGNLALFRKDLQANFEKSPLGFYKAVVEPLIPKEMIISGDVLQSTVNNINITQISPEQRAEIVDRQIERLRTIRENLGRIGAGSQGAGGAVSP